MKYEDLKKINETINYLSTHNKNYNKTQYYYIEEIKDIINAEYKKEEKKQKQKHFAENGFTKKKIKEIENFILEYAKMGEDFEGYAYYEIDENIAITIGWLGGYDYEDKETLGDIVSPDGYGLNVGITENPRYYAYTDYEYLKMPYYKDGEVCNTQCTLSQKDIENKCKNITDYLVSEAIEIIKLLDSGELTL